MQLCDYGCGKEALYKFKNGKSCCSDTTNKCKPPKVECNFCHNNFTKRSISIHIRQCLYNPINNEKLKIYEKRKNTFNFTCEVCNKKHNGLHGNGECCSHKCSKQNGINKTKRTLKTIKIVKCIDCNKEIEISQRTLHIKNRCLICKRKYLDNLIVKKDKTNKKERGKNWSPMTLYRFGLTEEQFENIKREQNNKCKLCNNDLKSYTIDHCHKTGKIRGILCIKCNNGLGLFNDDIELLKKAVNYIDCNM